MLDVAEPRAVNGRAPDVFRAGKWVEMRGYDDHEEVDFAIVGTGAGGGTLACKLAEAGFSVVAFEAGPFWRPLDDFVSDERWQGGLFWTDRDTVLDAGPVKVQKAERKGVKVPPLIGGLVVVAGAVLLLLPSGRRIS